MRDGSLQSIPQSASQPRLPRIMEASVEPQPRGPDWMPITPKTGSLFHADSQQVLGFKPAPRLEQIGDIGSEQVDDQKHRIGYCAGIALPPFAPSSCPMDQSG